MPGRALRNTGSVWGGPGDRSYSVMHGQNAVDLEFLLGLPADSVCELGVGGVVLEELSLLGGSYPGMASSSCAACTSCGTCT